MHLTHPFTAIFLKLESVLFYPPYKGDFKLWTYFDKMIYCLVTLC